jgi:hypothetical protein
MYLNAANDCSQNEEMHTNVHKAKDFAFQQKDGPEVRK